MKRVFSFYKFLFGPLVPDYLNSHFWTLVSTFRRIWLYFCYVCKHYCANPAHFPKFLMFCWHKTHRSSPFLLLSFKITWKKDNILSLRLLSSYGNASLLSLNNVRLAAQRPKLRNGAHNRGATASTHMAVNYNHSSVHSVHHWKWNIKAATVALSLLCSLSMDEEQPPTPQSIQHIISIFIVCVISWFPLTLN